MGPGLTALEIYLDQGLLPISPFLNRSLFRHNMVKIQLTHKIIHHISHREKAMPYQFINNSIQFNQYDDFVKSRQIAFLKNLQS
ncbi:MAG: hypothetical protein AABY92_03065, partial [Thermodesulfobacteriota bacterium]